LTIKTNLDGLAQNKDQSWPFVNSFTAAGELTAWLLAADGLRSLGLLRHGDAQIMRLSASDVIRTAALLSDFSFAVWPSLYNMLHCLR
jgi:hypothetical protein